MLVATVPGFLGSRTSHSHRAPQLANQSDLGEKNILILILPQAGVHEIFLLTSPIPTCSDIVTCCSSLLGFMYFFMLCMMILQLVGFPTILYYPLRCSPPQQQWPYSSFHFRDPSNSFTGKHPKLYIMLFGKGPEPKFCSAIINMI